MEDGKIVVPAISGTVFRLTPDEKRKVDDFLKRQNLNEYGDSKDVAYMGGTPLFDEKSGKTMDRYEYILKKYPDILK